MQTLSVDQADLCMRYVRASPDDVQIALAQARADLRQHLSTLIQRLSPSDFEQLVDLTFARLGWLRVSGLGGSTKDIDLLVEQPLTRERIAVQVKSRATQEVVNDCAERLGERPTGERHLLICHSPDEMLRVPPAASGRSQLIVGDEVTDLALKAGLVDWVVERAR